MRYETSVRIAAPVQSVWEVLTDIEQMPVWTASMTSVERLDEGALAVGSRARVIQPKLPPAVWTVTELERQRLFTWVSTGAGPRVTAGHVLTEAEGTVTATLYVRMSGVLGTLFGALMGSRVRGYVQMEAAGLKERSERVAQA